MPYANHHGMEIHLEEISQHILEGRHGVVVMDRAGWHCKKEMNVPSNISILYLPPYSPELNPQENVWQYLKDRHFANRTFESYKDIIDACEIAWNKLAQSPQTIKSIASREWADIF